MAFSGESGSSCQSELVSPDSRVVHTLDLAENSALDCAWHVVPFEDESINVLVAYLSVIKEPGESDFT